MRNKDLKLVLSITTQSERKVNISILLFNTAHTHCFIKASVFDHISSHVRISGPSEIFCYASSGLYKELHLPQALKIKAKSYIASQAISLSGICDFHSALPGTYMVKYFTAIATYTDENLSYHDLKIAGIGGSASFELE